MTSTRIKIVHPPKIIDLAKQSELCSSYLKYGNKIVEYVLSEEDTIKYATVRDLFSMPLLEPLTQYLGKKHTIQLAQLVMNLSIVIYQNLYATWLLYFLTSRSGLKKIMKCVFENPIYGILYFVSFYFRLLGESDKAYFDKVVGTIGLPFHDKSLIMKHYTQVADGLIQNITSLFSYDVSAYKSLIMTVISQVTDKLSAAISTVIVDKTYVTLSSRKQKQVSPVKPIQDKDKKSVVASVHDILRDLSVNIEESVVAVLKDLSTQQAIIQKQEYAVYITGKTLVHLDDKEIADHLLFLKDRSSIKRIVKQSVKNPSKDKNAKKRVLKTISEIYTPEGSKVCLDKCEVKTKATYGGYCEGKCGNYVGSSQSDSWCWIDETKHTRGKTRPLHLGKKYDKCDPKITSPYPICFTGAGYDRCG